jgi:hypothetical protein
MKPSLKQLLFITFATTFLIRSVQAQSFSDTLVVKSDSSLPAVILIPDTAAKESLPMPESHFEAGISYQSNDVYLGRKDSTVLPYIIPAFSYYHLSGLYATVSLNYLKNTNASRIDLVTIEGGYIFTGKNYDGQLSVSKYFYHSKSTSVRSEISASIAYQNGYDLGFIKPTFTGTLNIGSKLDFAGLFGLEHSFYFFDDRLMIIPTLAATASTQNYYNDYFKKRRYLNRTKGQVVSTGVANITGTVLNSSTFKLLDYEPTIPVSYTMGKYTIEFTPTYSIPVNPATVEINTTKENGGVTKRTKTEKIENTFYWTLGIHCSF